MKMTGKYLTILLAILFAGGLLLTGCEDPGPTEEAGQEIDEAFEEAEESLEDLGDDAEDALDDLDNNDD